MLLFLSLQSHCHLPWNCYRFIARCSYQLHNLMTCLMSVTARGAHGKQTEGLLLNANRKGKLYLVIVKYLQNQYFRAVWLVDVHCTFDKQIRLHRLTCTKVRLCFKDRKALPEAPNLWLYKLCDNYILNCTYCTCHFVMITTKNNTTLGLTWIYCN